MPRSLTGLDAAFLYLETQEAPLHVAQICVFDPSTGPERDEPAIEQIRALILRRLSRVPPFHQIPVAIPGGLGHPVWAEDPAFDVDYHLRPGALAAPAGLDELAEFTAEFLSRPLDRRRPLWEMCVIEGLSDGMIAGVTKVHHSAIDGVSGAELTASLLDLEPEPAPDAVMEVENHEPPPSAWQLLGHAAAGLARQQTKIAGALIHAGTAAGRVWILNRRSPGAAPPAPFSAPVTPFNVAVGRGRRVALAQLDLGEVNVVRKAFDATVNDVVLSVCAGGLRAYLEGRGLPTGKDLVAAVPVSVRAEETESMGNRLTAMLVTLATTIEDPAERLRAIAAGARRAKDQSRAIGAGTLGALAELVPPVIGPRLGRIVAGLRLLERPRPLFNVMISNFRGPAFPLYCAGAKLIAAYPLGPVLSGAALNITLQSYLDTLFVGLVGDADAVPDLDRLPGLLEQALAELVKKAEGSVRRSERHLRALS